MSGAFDAIIIGAGQAGPPLAGRLAAAGMKVAHRRAQARGRTCVNTGCMPTKTMVASAYAAHLARRGGDYGVRIGGDVTVDMKRVHERAAKVSSGLGEGLEAWLQGLEGLYLHPRPCAFHRAARAAVDQNRLTAPRIFVNVGGRANIPQCPA